MSVFNNPNDILLLKNLLSSKPGSDDSDSDEEAKSVMHNFSPANVGGPVKQLHKKKASPYDALTKKVEPQVENIEEWQELQLQNDAQLLESRARPEYNIVYRQKIGTEDVFLQLGNRTGATASCEDMILEILLPEDTTPFDKMGLNITETEIELSTNKYYLKMPLVHAVNVDRCNARYDAANGKLLLTLSLVRELDFVNF